MIKFNMTKPTQLNKPPNRYAAQKALSLLKPFDVINKKKNSKYFIGGHLRVAGTMGELNSVRSDRKIRFAEKD